MASSNPLRKPQLKMRDRRTGGDRNRSPPPPPPHPTSTTKTRDPRLEWGMIPNTRPPPPLRRLRSFSPPPDDRDRSRRVFDGGRLLRSPSVERRDYTMTRHLDNKKRETLSPPPFGSGHSRTTQSQFNEIFQESPSIGLRHKYHLLTDPKELNVESAANPSSGGGASSSRASNKDKGFEGSVGGSSSALDGQGMLVQNSMYMEDGSRRTFFTLPPDVGYSAVSGYNLPSVSRNFNIGIHDDEGIRYHDRLHSNKMLDVQPYEEDEEEKNKLYPRDAPYSVTLSSQSRAFGGTLPGLTKDEFLGSYQDALSFQSDGLSRSRGNFTEALDSDGYSQSQAFTKKLYLKDAKPYGRGLLSPSGVVSQDYDSKLGRRERGDMGGSSSELLLKKMQPGDLGDYVRKDPFRFVDSVGDRVNDTETSRRDLGESGLWAHHPSFHGDAIANYHDLNRVRNPKGTDPRGEYVGSGGTHFDFGMKAPRDRGITQFGVDYGFGRDAGPVGYREKERSPPIPERGKDIYVPDISPQWRSEKLDVYDPSERMLKRKYVMDDNYEMNRRNPSRVLPNNRNTSRKFQEPSSGRDEWLTGKDRVGLFNSKRLGFGRTQYRVPGRSFDARRISVSDASVHVKGGLRNIKRRLRPSHLGFHNSFSLDRRQEFHRPYKFWRGSLEDRHISENSHVEDLIEDKGPIVKKPDPPEGSEEFKQLVHRAFLRLSKQLNENPAQQRRYRLEGKAGSVLCSVCGSLSKEFVDTHSLVTHTFNSLKVGLRTDHLGLHKALCVLMGWNSLIAPDTAKVYQSIPSEEALALKKDLILWPPLIVIHNSSSGNKNANGGEVLTIEGMQELLREMGFSGGKTKVCYGKPRNKSIFVVKFMPTFSGLQEAEKLHKHYVDNKHGREELLQKMVSSSKDSSSSSRGGGGGGEVEKGAAKAEKAELLIYGYMGIAEDLDKLDSETKKRCLVKSKKDIEAIADAPLS